MTELAKANSSKFPTSDELEYYKLYRDRVVNEDTLIYHRLSWFLGSQTILFILWAAVLKGPTSIQTPFHAVTVGFCIFGLVSCFVSTLGVWAALSEIAHLQVRYEKYNPSPHVMLPPIVGNPDHHLLGKVPPYLLIVAVAVGWVSVWVFLA